MACLVRKVLIFPMPNALNVITPTLMTIGCMCANAAEEKPAPIVAENADVILTTKIRTPRISRECVARTHCINSKCYNLDVKDKTMNVINFLPLLAWMLLFPVAVAVCKHLDDPMAGSEQIYLLGCLAWAFVGLTLSL